MVLRYTDPVRMQGQRYVYYRRGDATVGVTNVADDADFGRRLRDAKRAWEQAHDQELTWDQVGARVAEAMGRKPIKGGVAYRWFMNGREPKEFRETVLGIARAFGASPCTLAFGDGEGGLAVDVQHRGGRPRTPFVSGGEEKRDEHA